MNNHEAIEQLLREMEGTLREYRRKEADLGTTLSLLSLGIGKALRLWEGLPPAKDQAGQKGNVA